MARRSFCASFGRYTRLSGAQNADAAATGERVSGRRVRRSTTLPQFRPDPYEAVEAALAAELSGLDGVFVYDHLFPLRGAPGDPAAECLSLLGWIAAVTTRLRVGTLVLRVGLRPSDTVVRELLEVAEIAGGAERVVVAVGTGDHMNRPENQAFGVPFEPVAARVAAAEELASRLLEAGFEVWIGGRGRPIRQACARVGAIWNVWEVEGAELDAMLAEVPQQRVTWGGIRPPSSPLPDLVEEIVTATHMLTSQGGRSRRPRYA